MYHIILKFQHLLLTVYNAYKIMNNSLFLVAFKNNYIFYIFFNTQYILKVYTAWNQDHHRFLLSTLKNIFIKCLLYLVIQMLLKHHKNIAKKIDINRKYDTLMFKNKDNFK